MSVQVLGNSFQMKVVYIYLHLWHVLVLQNRLIKVILLSLTTVDNLNLNRLISITTTKFGDYYFHVFYVFLVHIVTPLQNALHFPRLSQ